MPDAWSSTEKSNKLVKLIYVHSLVHITHINLRSVTLNNLTESAYDKHMFVLSVKNSKNSSADSGFDLQHSRTACTKSIARLICLRVQYHFSPQTMWGFCTVSHEVKILSHFYANSEVRNSVYLTLGWIFEFWRNLPLQFPLSIGFLLVMLSRVISTLKKGKFHLNLLSSCVLTGQFHFN